MLQFLIKEKYIDMKESIYIHPVGYNSGYIVIKLHYYFYKNKFKIISMKYNNFVNSNVDYIPTSEDFMRAQNGAYNYCLKNILNWESIYYYPTTWFDKIKLKKLLISKLSFKEKYMFFTKSIEQLRIKNTKINEQSITKG